MCAVLFVAGLVIIFWGACKIDKWLGFYEPHHQRCPVCGGDMIVRDYGIADQFTETIQPCAKCGYVEDECRGC